MTRFKYGNLKQRGLYIDETTMRMCYTHRRLLAGLALQLIAENKDAKALKVLEKSEKEIPEYNVPYNFESGGLDMAQAYAMLGQKNKAKQILQRVVLNSTQYANWYLSLSNDRFMQSQSDCLRQFMILNHAAEIAGMVDKNYANAITKQMNASYRLYQSRGGQTLQGQ